MLRKINSFGGIAPKHHASRLPDGFAQEAVNTRFERGVLESHRGLEDSGHTLNAATRVIHKYQNLHWMGFSNPVITVADAHQVSDPWDYLLIADVEYPKVTRNDIATSSKPYPSATFRLGVPQPPVADGAPYNQFRQELDTTPEEGVDLPTTTVYRFSFVDGFGREGALSSPSPMVRFYEGFDDIVVPLPTDFVGTGHFLTDAKIRIYRANYGDGGVYQFVDEVDYGLDVYIDSIPSDELGFPPETDDWYPPPDDDTTINPSGPLRNLTAMPGGFFVGSTGDELCASVPDAPHAWPYAYRIPLGYKIVGIQTTGNAAVVATTGPVYVVQGVDPSALQPTRINSNQSCVSARSMVNVGGAVIYASPDGLVGVAGYDAQLLTQELVTKEEWQEIFKPEEIHGYYYEGKYIFFNNTRGWVFRPNAGAYSLSELSFVATAGYSDLETDSLYLLIGNKLQRFDEAAERLTYSWKSSEIRTATPTNFSYMRVVAEDYPVTATLTAKKANGTLSEQTITFENYEPRVLRSGHSAKEFYIHIQGNKAVKSVDLAHNRAEFDDA